MGKVRLKCDVFAIKHFFFSFILKMALSIFNEVSSIQFGVNRIQLFDEGQQPRN